MARALQGLLYQRGAVDDAEFYISALIMVDYAVDLVN